MAAWKFHKKRAVGLLLALVAVVFGVIGYWVFRKPVDASALDNAIAKADRLVVLGDPFEGQPLLYESTDRKEIDLLGQALKVEPPKRSFFCGCAGTESMIFYRGEKVLARVSNHHGVSIRCNLWDSDACLVSPEAMLSWFDARGMHGPRAEVEPDRVGVESSQHWGRWVAAVPKGLEEIWDHDLAYEGRPKSLDSRVAALESAFPTVGERILSLYAWYGSGAGPWSGFPVYELVGEDLLLAYQITELVEAAQSKGMTTPSHWEGAARLFGGWAFAQKHPKGLEQVPTSLKETCWNHVKSTQDKDKLHRAEVAFLPNVAANE